MEESQNSLTIITKQGDVGIVNFTTTQVLDEVNVQQLGRELMELVDKHYLVKIVINFEKVKFLSSAVLGKLISLSKRISAEKGRLAFCHIRPEILQVFQITRLDKLIPILDKEDEAVRQVQKGGGWFGRAK